MPTKTIAVASGKGGTGKTTVAVNLAAVSATPVALLDCDVEEPNVHLFLRAHWDNDERVTVDVPEFDSGLCQRCGACRAACRFHAIALLPAGPLLFPELCHSCGGCLLACPQSAIAEMPREIGTLRSGSWEHIHLAYGTLDIGEAKSPPLIDAVRRSTPAAPLVMIDAPPGTSCPMVAAVRDVDYVVLVTEPTPLGLHDLRLAVDTLRDLGLPCGVVINRAGRYQDDLELYCREARLPLLAELPFDRRIAEAYARGAIVVDSLPEYRAVFRQLLSRIVKHLEIVDKNRQGDGDRDTVFMPGTKP